MLQDSTQTSLWRLLVAAMSEKKKLNKVFTEGKLLEWLCDYFSS